GIASGVAARLSQISSSKCSRSATLSAKASFSTLLMDAISTPHFETARAPGRMAPSISGGAQRRLQARVIIARSSGPRRRPPSLAFQSISPGYDLEFAVDGLFHRYDGVHLEPKRGEHRTEFVNGHQIVALHEHVPAPLAHSDHKEVDLE